LIQGAIDSRTSKPTSDASFALRRVGSVVIRYKPIGVHFGPCGCPYLIVDNCLIEWRTGKTLATMPWDGALGGDIHFSAQGRFAVSRETRAVYQLPAGTKAFALPSKEGTFLTLAGDSKLVLHERGERDGLAVFKLENSQDILRIVDPSDSPIFREIAKVAGCPHGNEIAFLMSNWSRAGSKTSLIRFSLQTGKQIDEKPLGLKLLGNIQLCYSPDGDEIHLCCSNEQEVLIAAGNRGEQIVEQVRLPRNVLNEAAHFECLPDNSGWIFNHWIIDRKAKIPVVSVFPCDNGARPSPFWFVDRDHVLVDVFQLRQHRHELKVPKKREYCLYQIPWDRIRASLAARERGDPAWMDQSTRAVSLRYSGPAAETCVLRPSAQASLEQQFAARNLTIEAGAPILLDVNARHWHAGAEELATYKLQWHAEGKQLPGWKFESSFRVSNPAPFEIPKAGGRGSLTVRFSGINDPGSRLEIPYFVPQSPELVTLPLSVQ
jgi:hypothetical protein